MKLQEQYLPRAQDAFNIVWKAFVVDKRPLGWDKKEERCVYRNPEDPSVRCAVGWLMPDEVFNRLYANESASIHLLYQNKNIGLLDPMVSDFLDAYDKEFLEELQLCHDVPATDQDMFTKEENYMELEKRLRELAELFELKVPEKE